MNRMEKTPSGKPTLAKENFTPLVSQALLLKVFLARGWLPSVALGLLATALGTFGLLGAARADELQEHPSAGLAEGLEETEATQHETLLLQTDFPGLDSETVGENPLEAAIDESDAPQQSGLAPSPSEPPNQLESPAVLSQDVTAPETVPTPEAEPLVQEDGQEAVAQTDELAVPLAPDEVRILTPQAGTTQQGTTDLVVQYNAEAQIQVSVNENPLDPDTPTHQERDEAQNLITQFWYDIPLEAGENTLTVQAGDGVPTSIQIAVAEKTARNITIAPVGNPQVEADGRSTIALEGQITDENGELISEDTLVTLVAGAGEFVGADRDEDQLGFQVIAREGQFTAELRSNLEAQKVRIRAVIVDKENTTTASALFKPVEAYTQVQFTTNLRPPIVSGVINLRIGEAGTDFWGRRRDFLDPDLIDEGAEIDFESAFFARGRIGEWLFTGAYNSERPLNETCDGTVRLFREFQACEQNYPVYGDSSTVEYLAPSTDSVYFRLERTSPVPGAEADYAMWGDYRTREFARSSQLFSATSRALHGFKGNYSFGNLQLTALYSEDIEGFQRDTIAPNGTSGYYFLSRRLLIEGSEEVYVETEEIDRPGTVIERQRLYRGADYEIDYDRGSLLFRDPILATELASLESLTGQPREGLTLLVRRIVVVYQYESDDSETQLYGGRLQYNFSQEFGLESWVAATYLHEDQDAQDFELLGFDFRVPLGDGGEIIGEYAHSQDSSVFFDEVSGSAYRLEARGNVTDGLNLSAYYRRVEDEFRNNATASFAPGQMRYGAAANARITSTTNFRVSYDYEENFGIAPAVRTGDFFDIFALEEEPEPGSPVNNSLRTIRAGIQQQIGTATLNVDFVNRFREDDINDTFEGNASQLVSYLGVPLFPNLTFRAQNELSLDEDDALYPDRTTLALDWGVMPGVKVQLAHQFFDGGLLGDDSLTRLDTIVAHDLWENTSITGRYSIVGGVNGMTGQGAVGLRHVWAVTPGLRVNLGYEHTFSNTEIPTAAGDRFRQPYAVGQSASSLALLGGDVYSVGIEYTDNPDFKASFGIEHRTGAGNDNTVIRAAAAGKLSSSWTALFRYDQANFANQLLEDLDDTITLRLGLAYRNPKSDRWNALMRYEYRRNPSSIPETILFDSGTDTSEHVFAAEAIYAPNWRWEFYGKGAFRHSATDLADDFDNASTVFLTQLRAAYRLSYRMDLAVEGRWIGQDGANFDETGFAIETGYYLTPDLRLAVGYSFGSVDDRDFSGYRSEGGPYLGVTFKLNELFGGFGRQQVTPPQQEESLVRAEEDN